MRKILFLALAALLSACGDTAEDYDATGTFEATEITVSAEQTGKLLRLDINEGDKVAQGQQVGLIDTVQLYLKARQLGALRMVYQAQKPETQTQIAALRRQIRQAEEDVARYRQLVDEGAANRKLLDDARSALDVLRRRLAAQASSLNTSTRSLSAQMGTADVEKLQVADQLAKCRLVAPISGTVLEKYAEAGEYAVVGRPLFKLADTDRLFLRAYVTSAQLKDVRLGQPATVWSDFGGGERRKYRGTVAWISAKSEFTPKTILTDDERADLVYAVKVAVKNDGMIKIGMYGEVCFGR